MRYLLDADWIIQVLAGRREAVIALTRLNPEGIAVSMLCQVMGSCATPILRLKALEEGERQR